MLPAMTAKCTILDDEKYHDVLVEGEGLVGRTDPPSASIFAIAFAFSNSITRLFLKYSTCDTSVSISPVTWTDRRRQEVETGK